MNIVNASIRTFTDLINSRDPKSIAGLLFIVNEFAKNALNKRIQEKTEHLSPYKARLIMSGCNLLADAICLIAFVALKGVQPLQIFLLSAIAIYRLYLNTISRKDSTPNKTQIIPHFEYVQPPGNYPLIEPSAVTLFDGRLAPESVYRGANAEKIPTKNGEILLPRSLYHFFFIYFALKHKVDGTSYPILKHSMGLVDERASENLDNWILGPGSTTHREKIVSNIRSTTELFHEELLLFFSEREIPEDHIKDLTWEKLNEIIEALWGEFESFKTPLDQIEESSSNGEALYYSFYRFCFNPQNAKSILINGLAIEWNSPSNREILYRCANLSKDDLKNDTLPQSLSFSSSLYSGIVFEGNGTCVQSYYQQFSENQELYALSLKPSKVEKYFFYPTAFKENGLTPLIARGEFSHPRLRTFINQEERVQGVSWDQKYNRLLASYSPTDKIPTLEHLRAKIRKIYINNLVLLGIAKNRPVAVCN